MVKKLLVKVLFFTFFLFVFANTAFAQEVDQAKCTADCPSGATCQLQPYDFPSASMKACSTNSVNKTDFTPASAKIYHVSIKNNSSKTITGY